MIKFKFDKWYTWYKVFYFPEGTKKGEWQELRPDFADEDGDFSFLNAEDAMDFRESYIADYGCDEKKVKVIEERRRIVDYEKVS